MVGHDKNTNAMLNVRASALEAPIKINHYIYKKNVKRTE